MERTRKTGLGIPILCLLCLVPAWLVLLCVRGAEVAVSADTVRPVSDHFDGTVFFNPGYSSTELSAQGREPQRSRPNWIWRWLFGTDWPEWPEANDVTAGPAPVAQVSNGIVRITPIGHSTFLIQMDGLNILTDPIWSERCGPVSWAGPRRRTPPGIRFDDLPAIDVVLVSHNHYDHLDLPTLTRLAKRGTPRSVVTLGNGNLVRGAGIPIVDALDWWQEVRLSPDVTVALVPARHFSSRTLWDRNETLWGGFVISGTSGNVYYAGDTGYGPHFREIARRFSPIRVALLPIAPFRPQNSKELPRVGYPSMHMGPREAVQAHEDLGARLSIACHFQVFQLGPDGFHDAVNELAAALEERRLTPEVFVAPVPGQAIESGKDQSARSATLSIPAFSPK